MVLGISRYCGNSELVDFELDVDDESSSNCIDAIGRISGENGIGGSSIEGDLKPDQDEEMFQDFFVVEDEPYIGQEFDSEAAEDAFYNAYAMRVGFVIMVSKLSRSTRDGSAIGRALVCNREGFRMPDKKEKIVRQRVETRVGCRAMILVRKLNFGKWVITKFVQKHTHPLTPGKGRKDYDQYLKELDKIRESSQQLAIEKKQAATYKRHLEMVFEYIEEHNQIISKKIQHIEESVREIEPKVVKSPKRLTT